MIVLSVIAETTQPCTTARRLLVVVSPSETSVEEGGVIMLRCRLESGSSPGQSVTYSWTKGKNGPVPHKAFVVDNNKLLLVLPAQVSDSGNYHCHVRNALWQSDAAACVGVGGQWHVCVCNLSTRMCVCVYVCA